MINTLNFFQTSMDTISNARKDIYIATKKDQIAIDDYGNEIVEYEKPKFLGKLNYQPMTWRSLQSYMSVYGETKSNVVQCLIDYKDKDLIKEFDKAYLYEATPEGEIVNGENANYIVKACRVQNTKVIVIMEEIIKEE